MLQVLYKILKSERVSERNKQRIKLKDFGYLGLVCFLEDIPVTMTTVRCLYEQVLATGDAETALCLGYSELEMDDKSDFYKCSSTCKFAFKQLMIDY